MTPHAHRVVHPRSRRRHDLEMLAIPVSILLVMFVLALLDTLYPNLL